MGYWQERKHQWISLGIHSHLGRGENLLNYSPTVQAIKGTTAGGTSVFDPVLCEVIYRWFCPPNGIIFDPFSGGSVRGLVAAHLKYQYHGVDIRAEQISENKTQATSTGIQGASWYLGDSRQFASIIPTNLGNADLIFSSPPYFNREHYSDLPDDLNNSANYKAFLSGYGQAIKSATSRLKENRFAVFEVAQSRNNSGLVLDLVSDTIHVFEQAGLHLYNHIIHVKPYVSAAIRAAKMFQSTRKVVPVHEHDLIFIKGDPRKATEAIGPVEVAWPESEPNLINGPESSSRITSPLC